MRSPLISIVIVNYNGSCHLEECLQALIENTDVAFEVIVVDNASTDGSATNLIGRYPGVRVIESDINLGYARGVNLGAHHALGSYLAILNMDIVVSKNWLSPLIEFLDGHPDAGAVAPRIMLYESSDRINALGQNVHITGLGFNRKLNWSAETVDPLPVQVSGLHGSAFVLRTSLFRQLGGMNEAYFMYHEDVEISLRLRLNGHEIYAVPDSVVYHKYVLHMTPEKLHWLERHRWLTIIGIYRVGTLLVLMPFLLLTEALMTVYCLSRGRSFVTAKVRAVRWIFSHWQELQESRRRTQAVRSVSDWKIVARLHWWYDWDQFLILARQRGGWFHEVVSNMFSRWSPNGNVGTDRSV
jgi:GT2 family glycosyltransferase